MQFNSICYPRVSTQLSGKKAHPLFGNLRFTSHRGLKISSWFVERLWHDHNYIVLKKSLKEHFIISLLAEAFFPSIRLITGGKEAPASRQLHYTILQRNQAYQEMYVEITQKHL